MKYIVILGDGMADYPVESLGNKTPLQVAFKPSMDYLASRGTMGTARMIPDGMPPGSDTANMAVLGYDPGKYYSGRSPFEAAGMKVAMEENQVSFRCNLVTLSEEEDYENKTMLDYSSGEIGTGEASELLALINDELSTEEIVFHHGISYRHLMLWSEAPFDWKLTPPHDIMGEKISNFLPTGSESKVLLEMMKRSHELLKNHDVNKKRVSKGLNPANAIWLWGEGKKPSLPLFKEKYGLKGSLISAVDLLRGIAFFSGMRFIEVPGATGNLETNYRGKAEAAVEALEKGDDFVFIHIEAPDECAHQNQVENKVKAIEYIDERIIKTIMEAMKIKGIDYRMMVIPDHYTPLKLRTHTDDPVPFIIFDSREKKKSVQGQYDEESATAANFFFPKGYELMDFFLKVKL